jgi:ATP-dependent RNA helicase RhlE
LQAGVDILVATPGRLLDLIGQGFVKLAPVEILILDEADQMLDMGFIHDLRKIVAQVPDQRQTLMFSATMPKEIRKLAQEWLRRPFEVRVAAEAATPERVSQSVYFVQQHQKAATLTRFLQETRPTKTLVFSRTKRGADKIARCLQRDGIRAIAVHGGKSQAKRTAVIRQFNSKKPPVLVATDLASRGLDFSDISHVINYDLPEAPETYVHRIGRTARAGASGQAVSFCGRDERHRLRVIEKLTGQTVSVENLSVQSDVVKSRTVASETVQKDTEQKRKRVRATSSRAQKRGRRTKRDRNGTELNLSQSV